MTNYTKLTETDHLILNTYKSVLDGLAEYLGPGYEFVLHSLEDIDNSAIKVINGHYTGRKEGAPITDLAMQMLAEMKRCGNNHKNMIYFNRGKKGKPIRSATLPITGEQEQIIGLLCINFYMDIPLNTFFDSFFKLDNGHKDIVENFASNADDLIVTSIENARIEVANMPHVTAPNRNKRIIAILHQKDIFQLKDAVQKVASHLGISKNTVYLHLRKLNQEHTE